MITLNNRTLAALLAGCTAAAFTPTLAAAQGVFTGTGAAEDRFEDLQDDAQEDIERDARRFGNSGRELGYSASLALRASTTSGNTDNTDVGIAGVAAYYDGTNGYELRFAYDYAEDEDEKNEESFLYELQYTRDLTPRLYGFAELQGTLDKFSNYDSDTFVGFGVGYYVLSEPNRTWNVQAGVGYRVAELDNLNQIDDFEEPAVSLESDYFQRISDTTYFTNETDIITSDSDTAVLNDLGVTVAMSDRLALRTSLLTEYHSDPFEGAENTDNRLGVSLVMDF